MTYAAETERLYLEPLGLHHLEDFHELWNNEEAVLWSCVPSFPPRSQALCLAPFLPRPTCLALPALPLSSNHANARTKEQAHKEHG
jgi:hypothetical protein